MVALFFEACLTSLIYLMALIVTVITLAAVSTVTGTVKRSPYLKGANFDMLKTFSDSSELRYWLLCHITGSDTGSARRVPSFVCDSALLP